MGDIDKTEILNEWKEKGIGENLAKELWRIVEENHSYC